MAKKKKKSLEEEFKLLSKEQEKELQDMVNNMLDVAARVVDEYDDLDLSDLNALSGSITQVHEDSPYLDEIFKGNSWKRVITNLEKANARKDKEDDTE